MFLPVFIRLIASIFLEGAYNLAFLLLSLIPSRKKTMRNKMKSILPLLDIVNTQRGFFKNLSS